MFATLIMSVYF